MSSRAGIRKHLPSRARKKGLAPGSLVYVGPFQKQAASHPPRITSMIFEGETLEEREGYELPDILPLRPAPAITWINVEGLHHEALLAEFGETFQLNALLLEDILNTEQRPKAETLDNHTYIILKTFEFKAAQEEIATEQVSIVMGPHFVITFLEDADPQFDEVKNRLRLNSRRLCTLGVGYLTHMLLDTIIDSYFSVLEEVGERLETLEDSLSEKQPPNILQNLHRLKRELIFLRKNIWPVREILNGLQHADTEIITPEVHPYLRDLYDHTIQVMDTLESYRDLLSGLQDLYLSVLSYRMNDVMKVLTIMSSLFIPLTFIVGVYGMNFKVMPELDQPWGYPAVWLILLLTATGMLVYFKHKRWI
jgi:magnesium transporter